MTDRTPFLCMLGTLGFFLSLLPLCLPGKGEEGVCGDGGSEELTFPREGGLGRREGGMNCCRWAVWRLEEVGEGGREGEEGGGGSSEGAPVVCVV